MSKLYPSKLLENMDYEAYWQIRQGRPYPPRVYEITPLIESNSSVLDIGCGDGELFRYAKDKVSRLQWEGVDISETALRKSRAAGMLCRQGDISKSDFQIHQTYDYIVISEVLEHIANPEDVLSKARGHFRKSLILTVPNIAYYKHRFRMMGGRFPVQWQWHPSEHIRFWSLVDFDQFLKEQGFPKFRKLSTNGFPYENARSPMWHRLWPNLLAEGAVYVISAGSE
jgi:methionine biosynthesis protein MetW